MLASTSAVTTAAVASSTSSVSSSSVTAARTSHGRASAPRPKSGKANETTQSASAKPPDGRKPAVQITRPAANALQAARSERTLTARAATSRLGTASWSRKTQRVTSAVWTPQASASQ